MPPNDINNIQDSELDSALKAFNESPSVEQINYSKQVDTDPFAPKSKMALFLIKISGGLIKNEEQANYVLFAITIVITLSIFVLFFIAIKRPSPPPSYRIIRIAGPEYGVK